MKLSLREKLCYGSGDFSCNIYWQSISLFLLFYYTDVVGISAGTAGLIYMIASVFDGMIDPWFGAMADRTRSRFGRYKPWIAGASIPAAISFALVYYRPPLVGVGLVAYLLGAHMIFRVCYTSLGVPYTALSARITDDAQERASLASLRMVFAAMASVAVGAATLPLVAHLGGGNAKLGFFLAATVLAAIATSVLPLTVLGTRERVSDDDEPRLTLSAAFVALANNRAFLMLMGALVFSGMSITAVGKSIIYYFKYYVGAEGDAKWALGMAAAAGVGALPVWLAVTRRVGKRGTWLIASAWNAVGLFLFYLFPANTPLTATIFFVYMQIGTVAIGMCFWAMLPDTVEYGEWRNGVRSEAFLFGCGQFVLKVALGAAVGIYGIALELIGYRPNVQQTAETLANMHLMIVLLPGAGLLGGAVMMFFHPLRKGVHEEIRDQIARR